jgi:hypothetical protein
MTTEMSEDTTIFVKPSQETGFQDKIHETIQAAISNELMWVAPQAPDFKLYEPCFVLRTDPNVCAKLDRSSHSQVEFGRNGTTGPIIWKQVFQDPDDATKTLEFSSMWAAMDGLVIAQLRFLLEEMGSRFYLYFGSAGKSHFHSIDMDLAPDLQLGIRKMCPELGTVIEHARLVSSQGGRIQQKEISPVSIQSCGLLLGSSFLPFDEIVEISAPSTLLLTDPTLARAHPDGLNLPLAAGEGNLVIKWKPRGERIPRSIIIQLSNADAVLGEISAARKTYRNR